MRKFVFSLSIALGLSANAQVALHGLYTPVPLQPDTTFIYLRDYVAAQSVLEVQLPPGLQNHSGQNDTLILTGKLPQKLGTLTLTVEEGERQLLLINNSAVPTEIKIKADALAHDTIYLFGEFNNWNRESEPLVAQQGYFRKKMYLAPGRYEYKLWVNEKERTDPSNPNTVSNGMGGKNNLLKVPAPPGKAPIPFQLQHHNSRITITQPESSPNQYLVLWNNERVKLLPGPHENTLFFNIPAAVILEKRSYIRVFSYAHGQKGQDKLIPLQNGQPLIKAENLTRQDWHQARLYFLMVDRFKNGNSENDQPVDDPEIQPEANYQGGDLQGVRQVLQSGYFDSLGVNTIWLSPITQNPLDAWGYWDKGKVKSKFSGYHGYWPISNTQVDFRFGNPEVLRKLLRTAHGRNYNMLLDYVANHVHLQHPVYQKNKDWATSLYLPDGTKNTEKWDSQRLTTWFDDHLPTLDLRRYEVVDPMVDSALVWLTQYNFDGFRHDATKHIDELYWRTLTYRIRQRTDRPVYQIGETYGSPQLINSYISTGMLDAQFDFNLYDAAVQAFATGKGLADLQAQLHSSLHTYGSHHLMGNISGNQDRTRFISYASGDVQFSEDAKLAGWERDIGKPRPEAYQRLALLHAFNYAIPGIPVIYYGDEIGLPGAGDPDNRRMMRFELTDPDEIALRQKVSELNHLRRAHLPLLYGTTRTSVNETTFTIHRRYLGQEVKVVLNLSASETESVPLSENWQVLSRLSNYTTTPDTLKLKPLQYIYLLKTTR